MSVGGEEKKAGFLDRVASVFRRDSQPDAVELAPEDAMHVADVEALAHEAFVQQQAEALAQLQHEAVLRQQREALEQAQNEAALQRQDDLLRQQAEAKEQLPANMTRGIGRTVLTAADVRVDAQGEDMAVDWVTVLHPDEAEKMIKERERVTGLKLDKETIDAERAMDATLDKTIPRLKRELEVAVSRKIEFASKKRHWEFAEDKRGRGMDACRVDRSLKKPKKAVDAQQAAADEAFAKRRKLEVEMMKLQDRMRKVAEDEQRARATAH